MDLFHFDHILFVWDGPRGWTFRLFVTGSYSLHSNVMNMFVKDIHIVPHHAHYSRVLYCFTYIGSAK